MDFTLTDGQKKLVSAFRTFGADTFTPERVAKWCRDQGLPDTVMKEFVDLYYETAEPDIAPDLAHSLLSQVLIVAQQSADKLVEDARANAESIRNDADQKAREVIRQALAEKQNELDEIDRLKASREEFRTEYKKLLQHFMDDAESVFPAQGLGTSLSGSKGTTHTDAAPAPVVTPAPAPASDPAPAPAQGTVSGFGDFGDLD